MSTAMPLIQITMLYACFIPDSGVEQSMDLLNHSGYIGPIISNIFLIVLITVYVAFR